MDNYVTNKHIDVVSVRQLEKPLDESFIIERIFAPFAENLDGLTGAPTRQLVCLSLADRDALIEALMALPSYDDVQASIASEKGNG